VKYIIAIIIMSIILFAPSLAWYPGFLYRKCFDLIEVSNTTFTNYTYKLIIDTSSLVPGKIKSDCSDLIVTDANDTKLKRFVVNCGLGNTYVYFPIDVSALGRATYCLYYGNPNWNEINDGSIFPSFEDFEYRTSLSWTFSGCSITDADKFTGYYSVLCSRNGYIQAYLYGNELNFASKGSVAVGASTYTYATWTLATSSMTSGTIRFTARADNTYIDTVYTRYAAAVEPKTYFYPEETQGAYTATLKSYCIDDYVVNEQYTCVMNNCSVNKTLTYCYYGCYAGRCNESPFNRAVVLVLVAIGLLFLFYIVWRLTR
jgi:hypothetical protein